MSAAVMWAPSVKSLFGGRRAKARRASAAGLHFKALQHWLKLAARGDAEAEYQIGVCYDHGLGVVRDPIEAASWHRKAAGRGHAGASLSLGRILINGAQAQLPASMKSERDEDVALLFPNGVKLEADPAQAIALLRAAAEQGEAEACALLGAIYFEGVKTARDLAEARKWYARAAEAGVASAQFGLADMLFNGHGDQPDEAGAADWYEKAAQQGHARAQTAMGFVLQNGRGRERDLAAAGAWYEKAAVQGDWHALYVAAQMHFSGEGLPVNAGRGETYLRAAAKRGHLPSMLALAELYRRGLHVALDPREAVTWFAAAGQTGHVEAKFQTAQLLAAGARGGTDPNEIAALYAQAAEAGHPQAAYCLGALIADGEEENRAAALPWLQMAAERGAPEAPGRLAELHLDEASALFDKSRGLFWLRRATEVDPGARERLAVMLLRQGETPEDFARAERLLLQQAGPQRPEACFALAEHYARGRGGRPEPDKAARWYAAAATAGHHEARFVIAMALLERPENTANVVAGVASMRALAEAGHAAAQFEFGVLHCRGLGVLADFAEALVWFRKSAEAGYAPAEYNLGVMLLKGQGAEQDVAEGRRLIALAVEKGVAPLGALAT